ncbi:hypothetical protein FACS189491_09020 [Spirochaetia bacterium]|nr:hypothetical protein FACS189491_09020 [Spirochaetia bacterium]
MKLLLILGSDDTSNLISRQLQPLGFEMIHYHHVLKAMDNVDEVDPQGIIISAADFPRHWKALTQFVRSEQSRSKKNCPIILLSNGKLSPESYTQAFYIGVNGIVNENLDNGEMERLKAILTRCAPAGKKRFGLLISNPGNNAIIPGTVKVISGSGLSFLPDHAAQMADISRSTILDNCSLRVGGSILSPVCRLAGRGPIASLQFISFPPGEYKILQKYLKTVF